MESESTRPETKDFMKVIRSPGAGKQRRREKPNSDGDGCVHHDITTDLNLTNGDSNVASHGVYLFRTYMATKAPNKNITKARKDAGGPGGTRQPLLPPQFGCDGPRCTTRLEREIFPHMRNMQFSDCNSATPQQLTIFYGGTVHVYSNVPVDKAQAITLLAGESSLMKAVVAKSEDIIKTIPPHQRQISLPSICKPQDIPMARKNSLCLFLQKRHDRITNKSPYRVSDRRHREMEPREEEGLRSPGNDHHFSPLSPFPSRSGFLCSLSATKK